MNTNLHWWEEPKKVLPKPKPKRHHHITGLSIGFLFGFVGAFQLVRGVPLWIAAVYTVTAIIVADLWLARH